MVIVSVSLDEETVKKNTAVNGVSVMTTAVLSMTTPSVEALTMELVSVVNVIVPQTILEKTVAVLQGLINVWPQMGRCAVVKREDHVSVINVSVILTQSTKGLLVRTVRTVLWFVVRIKNVYSV